MESNQQEQMQEDDLLNQDDPQSILQNSVERVSKKKEKPHVTWDEEQIAEHNLTRGQKMKIDEPKTPYVTDEEFKQLCMDDPDYVKEMGLDINSQEAMNDVLSDKDMHDDMVLAQQNSKINAQISNDVDKIGGHNSDDEISSPKKDSLQMPQYYDKQMFAQSTKKNCESSLMMQNPPDFDAARKGGIGSMAVGGGLGGLGGGLGGLDFGDLNSKLEQLHDEDEEAAQKKAAFDKKRQNHYKNEFQMAKLLKQKQEVDEEDEEDEEGNQQ